MKVTNFLWATLAAAMLCVSNAVFATSLVGGEIGMAFTGLLSSLFWLWNFLVFGKEVFS